MSITVEQLRHAIEDDQTDYPQFTKTVKSKYSDYTWEEGPANGQGWDGVNSEGFSVVIDGELLEATAVDSTGGMDEGSNASTTWQIGDQYFRKSGYYASHYGYDWDGELGRGPPGAEGGDGL